MAIFHMSVGHVSRSTGRSSVQSAAYMTGTNLYETRRDMNARYANRADDVIWSETTAPTWAPSSFSELSVWDYLESFEDAYAVKRYPNDLASREKYISSARTAMTLVVALPRELSPESLIELVKEFVHHQFTSQGLIVTSAIHGDEGNPHAHMQVSRRSVEEDGTLSWAKNRVMCLKKTVLSMRKEWADLTNSFLERDGFDVRITEKSFVDLGLPLTPTEHRGWYSDTLAAQGIQSRIVFENERAFEDNKNKILERPEIIVNELTINQATFTQTNLLKIIRKRMGDDDQLIGSVFEKALEKAILIGTGIDGSLRYTSERYQQLEVEALAELDHIMRPHVSKKEPFNITHVDAFLTKQYSHMSVEQKDATLGLISDNRFAVLLGRAGSGKTTTTVKATCELYTQAGFNVIGTSLSALASENLGVEAHITSKTLTSWLMCWDRYYEAQEAFLSFDRIVDEGILKQFSWYQDLVRFKSFALNERSVIIVDEAGMIGTRQWHALLSYANKVGAKVIAVGDDNQFKAIEGGDFFREMKEQSDSNSCLFYLNTIRRQRLDWMKEASHLLAELHTTEGLSLYEQKGHIHETEDSAHLSDRIAEAYMTHLEKGETNGLVLAFTHAQTHLLNQAIRLKLRESALPGHTLSQEDVLTLPKNGIQDAKSFALGDKIVFLKNNKEHVTLVSAHGEVINDRSVKNGTVGMLEHVDAQGEHIVVRLDPETTAHFRLSDYNHISHGYALTCHKSQGQTVDFTLVAASKYMDAKGVYVAMTRHRKDVQLFYSTEEFKDFRALSLHLSRFQHKDLVKDYTIHPDNLDAWHRVQEYQHCIYDAAALKREAQAEGSPDWPAYHAVKQGHIALGREILNDFDTHKLYLHQAGLTQENLLISTGRKARSLTEAEKKAQLRVELYGEAAQSARELWKTIKHTRPSNQHPKFKVYQELRFERDTLAKEILENYPLHREFVNSQSRHFGINKKTLENQVAYRNQKQHAYDNSFIKEPIEFSLSPHNLIQTSAGSEKVRSITFERTSGEIARDLNTHIKDLALHFLGKPTQQNTKQWRYGKKGSIALAVNGTSKGMYTNFETGVSGNSVTFIADQLGLTKKEAFKWGIEWLGYGNAHTKDTLQFAHLKTQLNAHTIEKVQAQDTWHPIFPVTKDLPDLRNTPSLAYLLKGRTEVARYTYKDGDDNTLGYVIRLEDKEGIKITPTLTYCRNDQDIEQWRWKGFGSNRPIYGLDQLALKPDAPVLIVEGEKTCEAARHLFPEHAVITWSGGCGSVHKSDWSVLAQRDVTLWPDHDKAGFNAALNIGEILSEQGTLNIRCVELPSTLPHKWDLADQVPEGIHSETLMENAPRYEHMKIQMNHPQQVVHSRVSYEEVLICAEKEDLTAFTETERIPLILHVADKTYRELNELTLLNKGILDLEKIKQKAILTGLYTSYAKNFLHDLQNDTNLLEKATLMGSLIAQAKIDHPEKDPPKLIFGAERKMQEIEKSIQKNLDNPMGDIKQVSPVLHEELVRAHYRFQALHEKGLPHNVLNECFKALHQTYTQASHLESELHLQQKPEPHVVRSLLHHMITEKSKGVEEIKPVSLDEAHLIHQQQETHKQNAMQITQQKMVHIEQQHAIQRQNSRGLEL